MLNVCQWDFVILPLQSSSTSKDDGLLAVV